MRVILLTVTIVITSASAYAQALDQPASCWPITTKGQVVVTRADGTSLKDTLLCMSRDQAVFAQSGTMALDSLKQISKPRDPVWDGFLKGASVGLVALVVCAPDCPAEPIARITLAYGLLGAIIDAAQGNNTTIYKRGPAPSLAWRIRF